MIETAAKRRVCDRMMAVIYYAKSADESGNKTTNREHLKSVAELALRFGEALSMPRLAWTAGILHDFGKYSEAFQSVLNGTATSIDHAICSAAFLYGANMTGKHQAYRLVAAAAAAHLPCRVVATQCIEAGVDLDFETMYRALAPLEAVIQAAGRCSGSGAGHTRPGDHRGVLPAPVPQRERQG